VRRWISLALGVLGIATLSCACQTSLLGLRGSTATPPGSPVPSPIELGTLPPLLANVEFPTASIGYPAG